MARAKPLPIAQFCRWGVARLQLPHADITKTQVKCLSRLNNSVI